MNPFEYYTQQSCITDPGKYAHLFVDLPRGLSDLCQVVDGIHIHYMSEATIHYPIPSTRLPEINLLYVDKMLDRLMELDDRPLTEPRPMDKRVVGCCRDAAVQFCAMARHQGIPTRVRVGFANYFTEYDPDFNSNHVIAEVWDTCEKRWRLVDPDLNERAMQDNWVSFGPLDVPRDRFQVGGLVWQLYQSGAIDPSWYGVTASSGMTGAPVIRGGLIQDLAALNKMELLCWDCWGLMLTDMAAYTHTEWSLLDQAALLTQSGNDDFVGMRIFYEPIRSCAWWNRSPVWIP
jgi:hypothetical protein